MKKLFLIVAAMFAVVSFSACSDDDKDINPNLIIGIGKLHSMRAGQLSATEHGMIGRIFTPMCRTVIIIGLIRLREMEPAHGKAMPIMTKAMILRNI